jgi:hypothetical protein
MPRRRSHGLTFAAAAAGAGVLIFGGVFGLSGCQVGADDNGCSVLHQLVIPGTTPLALLTDVRIDRAGDGLVIFGNDGTAVRWIVVDGNGAIGTEQSFPLPPDTLAAHYALAGVEAPRDRVIIGLVLPAANGSDAELRIVAAPVDGSAAPEPGAPIARFGGGVNALPLVAIGPSQSGMVAGAAWIDFDSNFPTYAFVDGQGQVVLGPAVIENGAASGYACLGFTSGKAEVTINYQRGPTDSRLGPNWMIADIDPTGGINTLNLNVAQPLGTMSCARTVLYDPMVSGEPPEYAIVWQDRSGSWLSVYYGPQTGMVKSFPFASSTDFGGPDLQPPIVGLAAFGSDFGVLYARSHAVELWRVDRAGNRRAGTLPLPSLRGDSVGVASTSTPGLMTSTYADLTGADVGRRLIVDAACY